MRFVRRDKIDGTFCRGQGTIRIDKETPMPTLLAAALIADEVFAPYPYGPDAADNLIVVSRLTDQVRAQVQDMINTRLSQRRSARR